MIFVTKAELPDIDQYMIYLKDIWESRTLTNNGKYVQLLEDKLKEYLKVDNMAVISNATLALQLILKALDIKGEVITTPFTFAATTNAILWEGLKPVFVDIDPYTFNIDAKAIEKRINKNTVAILAVHVYGNPCNVHDLGGIAKKNNIKLIYDAAHAFGVEYEDKPILSFGDISVLSFHATKIFNTGEGGAIVTKDVELLNKIKLIRNHGITSEYEVDCVGTNAKMTEFSAALGLCNLVNINRNILLRKERYEYYQKKLSNNGAKYQKLVASQYNYSYMPVVFTDFHIRDKIYDELLDNQIKSRKYFYPLTSGYNYFKSNQYNHDVETINNAQNISGRILCLPLYPDLEYETIDKIIEIINGIISK